MSKLATNTGLFFLQTTETVTTLLLNKAENLGKCQIEVQSKQTRKVVTSFDQLDVTQKRVFSFTRKVRARPLRITTSLIVLYIRVRQNGKQLPT